MSINKTAIALTGATGFLGSHLMASLCEGGHQLVILGRPAGKENLRKRIANLLRWFNLETHGDQIELAEIDFLKPRCGLSESRYVRLCAQTRQIIHCASSLNFLEKKRSGVFEANVKALKGILEFASDARVSFFYYIGTVYAAGINDGFCPEGLSPADKFNNVYEESKAQAEKIVVEYCEKCSIPFNIIRPSIVYGHSQTGRSLNFNALYSPVKSLQNIRDICLNDLKAHGGAKLRDRGIFLDDEGYLHLPLKIYLPNEGQLNLIPVDYFVTAVLSVLGNSLSGNIYHITSDFPVKMKTLAEYAERFLKIKGLELVYGQSERGANRNPAEKLFDRFTEPYRPYMSDKRIFERKNIELATGGSTPPRLSYAIFERCMEYAVNVGWGKTLFAM